MRVGSGAFGQSRCDEIHVICRSSLLECIPDTDRRDVRSAGVDYNIFAILSGLAAVARVWSVEAIRPPVFVRPTPGNAGGGTEWRSLDDLNVRKLMDESRFDQLIRLLGRGFVRRAILGAAVTLPIISMNESEARRRRRVRHRRRKRRKGADAVSCPAPWQEIPQGCALACSNNPSVCNSLGCDCYSSLYGQFCLSREENPAPCTATEFCSLGLVCLAG